MKDNLKLNEQEMAEDIKCLRLIKSVREQGHGEINFIIRDGKIVRADKIIKHDFDNKRLKD